jgi:hypothetical protein
MWLGWLLGCSSPPEAVAPAEPAAAPAPAGPVRTARVLETMDGGGYTFARMDACGQEAWVAGPPGKFTVGQALDMTGGAGMEKFNSPALGRTFDQILFVDAWGPAAAEPVCGPSTPPPSAIPADVTLGKVLETMNAAGYTYARLDVCGVETWIAAPETGVDVDTIAAYSEGLEMKDFHSEALNRTFASVWFVPWVKRSRVQPVCAPE